MNSYNTNQITAHDLSSDKSRTYAADTAPEYAVINSALLESNIPYEYADFCLLVNAGKFNHKNYALEYGKKTVLFRNWCALTNQIEV